MFKPIALVETLMICPLFAFAKKTVKVVEQRKVQLQ